MKILKQYLGKYWKMCVLVVVLAAINTSFSLIEPIVFQRIIDRYALRFHDLTRAEFFHGTIVLLLIYMGTALISRIAKNFQDYYLNTVSQRSGADMYREGVEHSLDLPYAVFEDERSGETLGKLQKARQDTEKLIQDAVNTVFTSSIILIFVLSYAATVYWIIPVIFFGMIFIIGGITLVFSKKIKTIQTIIVAETTALAGATTESLRNIELVKSLGLAGQEVDRLNGVTEKILKLELEFCENLCVALCYQNSVLNLNRRCSIYSFICITVTL